MSLKKLAVFVSGSGTNLQALIDACKRGDIKAEISLVVTDTKDCYAVKRAESAAIKTIYQEIRGNREEAYSDLIKVLENSKIDFIILAGFMKVITKNFTDYYTNRIINLHPALLPKYGGVGMYGDNVHKAVLAAGEKISGATVHYVDSGCDTGKIIANEMVNVYSDDSPKSLAERIHKVEHALLTRVVASIVEEYK